MKKVLCFIISLIMLFPLVVACDNNTDNEGGDTQTPASVISITVDGNEKTSLSMIVGAKIDVVANSSFCFILVDGEEIPLNDSNAKRIVLTNSTVQKVTLMSNLSFWSNI